MSNSETESILKKDGDCHLTKDDLKNEQETKDRDAKEPKSVSFNRDVHVKRFGIPRESRGSSAEHHSPIRKEPFTHLSTEELIEEANKVRAQAESVTCTADHPPEKFYSLPHRKKPKDHEKLDRRNSDETDSKKPLGRSTSDVARNKRTSLSTLFRRAQKKKPDIPVRVTVKPVVTVKRSKSDVTDLKSSNNIHPRPIRKRSGSETEEFLKSLRNKKIQLSPIIENSPRDDYFRKTPPLEVYQKKIVENKKLEDNKVETNNTVTKTNVEVKVNPIEKPPRYKSPDKEPKPPIRTKRGKSLEKELDSQPITETPKRKTDIKKTLLVDEIDSVRGKDINPVGIKDRIKESIRKIEENIYGTKDMIHSSQKPPEKPPLTRGHTVSPIVRILKEGSQSPTPKSYLLSPSYKTNNSQPFSYTRPSISPDHNIFNRSLSPEHISTPTKMDKGVVYAQVIRDQDKNGGSPFKQTVHKTYSPTRDKFTTLSDEDEGLGFEDRTKTSPTRYEYLTDDKSKKGGYTILDSPIRPRYREYKLTSFDDYNEPTYTNGFAPKNDNSPMIDTPYLDTKLRGRGDGMDTKRKVFEEIDSKMDLEFNELSHRRKLLESRLNARKYDRPINGETVTRYMTEMDPIYEANKKMKATEKYVNETAKYYSETLEKDGFAESSLTKDFTRYDSDNNRTTNHSESRTIERIPKGDIGRRDYIGPNRLRNESFPPEPEYEPPSLEPPNRKPSLSPNEYTEKKYKVKTKNVSSSHDIKKTKKDSWFGKRKGHYASNPEITERDDSPSRYIPKESSTYHNSLRREKHHKDKYKVTRHDSGDSQDYYRDGRSPKKYETDSRLIDSGIEPDFRKSSHNDIHKPKYMPESDDDLRDTSVFLDRERQHADESYPVERIYTNGEYITKFGSRERSVDDGAPFDPRSERLDKSPNVNDKLSAKPPKATKKLSGLEKVKQLFSRDSSKKSKKEKEVQKPRTRVLKSPEHLEEPGYKRYTDPEPSDDDRRKGSRSSREDLPGYRSADPRDSDTERKRELNNFKDPRKPKDDYKTDFIIDKFRDNDYKVNRYEETDYKVDTFKENYKPDHQIDRYNTDNQLDRFKDRPYKVVDHKVDYKDDNYEEDKFEEDSYEDERGYKINKYTKDKYRRLYREENKVERRRYGSSDNESGRRSPKALDSEDRLKKSRSKTAEPLDSPALAERNRERRRLATPSPSPSPTRRRAATPPAPASTAGNWFKSLDRLTSRKKKNKIQKETTTTEDELIKKSATNSKTNSPAKNLRFFGDTDIESDSNTRRGKLQEYERTHGSHPNLSRSRTSLDKSHTLGNNKHATLRKTTSNSSSVDETDREIRNYKKTDRERNYKLRNITEGRDSENESNIGRINAKPPRNPNDRSSRSHSSSKTLKPDRYGSKNELRNDDRGSSSELRGSKHELSMDSKRHRRRTPGTNSGESSTEGESSHPSQRSVVFLHATTVGDIPDPGGMSRNRSRDDVSSVNSSNMQVKTTQKSFSLFAPWTPRHYNDPYDVNYAQKPRKVQRNSSRNYEPGSLQKKKSYSQTTLSRRPPNYNQSRLSNSTTTLNRRRDSKSKENDNFLSLSRNKNRQSNEVLNKDGGDRISRSISMPKDSNKKAGWFNLNKNKKQEINTRVR